MKEEVEYVCSSVKRSVADADGEEDKERERGRRKREGSSGGPEKRKCQAQRRKVFTGSVEHNENKKGGAGPGKVE